MPSCSGHLEALAIPVGILTRNVRDVVETFARASTFGFTPSTPARTARPSRLPPGCWPCARSWVPPRPRLTVGDYKFDVLAGRNAGCRTALVCREPLTDDELPEWGSPDLVIRSLRG